MVCTVEREWDVIVVGAGTAGSVAARFCAERGLETLLVDSKPAGKIGDKVCGDAVSHHHFANAGVAPPSGRELAGTFSAVRVFSPDRRSSYSVHGKGYALNRYEFGQRLLREAVEAGATLWDRTRVRGPLLEGRSVVGVVAEREGSAIKVTSKVVIDASGWRGAVRSKLPEALGVERSFDPRDLSFCFREVVELGDPYPANDAADIYLDEEAAPGGYWWAFPKGSGAVLNVGLGVQMSTGVNPKRKYEERVLAEPYMKRRSVLDARAGVVPTRRPVAKPVVDGCVFVGDAASTANPLHGGGIGPSMYSARLAAEAAADAVEAGDYSSAALWPAAHGYMTTYGARAAALDAFRIFLQRLTNEDLNFGMSRRLIADEDLQALSDGRSVEVPLSEKAKRAIRGLARPSLLKKLAWVSRVMSEAHSLYMEYPESPERFEAWARRAGELFARVWGEVA